MQINETNPCKNIASQKRKKGNRTEILETKKFEWSCGRPKQKMGIPSMHLVFEYFFFVREMFCWAKGKFGF